MVEEDLGCSDVLDDLQEIREGIPCSPHNEGGTEAGERLVQLDQALLQPPSRDAAGKELTFLFRRPNKDGHYAAHPHCSRERRVVLHPQISAKPHHCADHLDGVSRKHNGGLPKNQVPALERYCRGTG